MVWIAITIIVFICVFLLIARMYVTKSKIDKASSKLHGTDETQSEASAGNEDGQ